MGVRSRSTRDSRASDPGVPLDSGVFPGFVTSARPRARLPFWARPQPAPGAHPISRALVGSARGVDLIHRDRFEGGPVDAAFGEDRLHPLRDPSNAAPGLLGVLRVAVLRGPFAAGEPPGGRLRRRATRVYPRTGGGTSYCCASRRCTRGLSPHGRGNREGSSPSRIGSGSIPARAGEPSRSGSCTTVSGVYPRTGGGTAGRRRLVPAHMGLSPHGRGNRSRWSSRKRCSGSIPARAGEPPRGCRERGILGVYPRTGGGTSVRRRPRRRPRVYPRTGGGTARQPSADQACSGLSPHGRGNLYQATD